MEFPELGVHCGVSSCYQLDFLPAKCDACENSFCQDHLPLQKHECPKSYIKDAQVPVCPLCGKIIPKNRRGDAPDVLVSQHMDTECQSDPAKEKRKAYNNRCQKPKCKKKELVPIKCLECQKNFCLTHRHYKDHDCQGKRSAVANAALVRQQQQAPAAASAARKPLQQTLQQAWSSATSSGSAPAATQRRTDVARRDLQGTLTEDEALARALQESIGSEGQGAASNQDQQNMTQEELDRLTALALQEELNGQQAAAGGRSSSSTTAGSGGNKSCNVS